MTGSPELADDRRSGAGLAKLGFWLAVLCVLSLVATVIATRTSVIGIRDAFGTIKWIVYGGGAVALIAFIGCIQAFRYKRVMAAVMAGIALLTALLIVWVPYSNRVALRASPRLSDVTTDTRNPPDFVKIAEIRKTAKARNPLTYGPEKADLQAKHYPDIKPVRLPLSVDKAFEHTLAAVNKLRWTVVAANEPNDKKFATIEASETSLIFGFVDDIIVRIVAEGSGSRIDIRSSSRVGRRDAAVNANRIRKLAGALQAR
jgi:uncharacterized protein (DUF1499 family)